jgi:hypothetical protein
MGGYPPRGRERLDVSAELVLAASDYRVNDGSNIFIESFLRRQRENNIDIVDHHIQYDADIS